MSFKFCPHCGKQSPAVSAKFCPNCGESLNSFEKKVVAAPTRQIQEEEDDDEGYDDARLPNMEDLRAAIDKSTSVSFEPFKGDDGTNVGGSSVTFGQNGFTTQRFIRRTK